jgi:alpha-methylacyl-CoA racemase
LKLRVLSIAQNVPGPLAVARLVEQGASARKIEPPGGDGLERMCASWYAELHAKVGVERLDLKSDEGRVAIRTRLADADLFLSSQRPSSLRRLGLDAATLHECFPSLRCLNIVGDRGNPELPGHDVTYQARAGLVGDELPATLVADVLGAERAFAAALLLLHEPPGSSSEIGLFDALAPMLAPRRHGLTTPGGWLGGGAPEYGVYETAEGHVAVGALEPHFRTRLYEALGLRPGSALGAIMRTRTAREWESWAVVRGLPMAAVKRGGT